MKIRRVLGIGRTRRAWLVMAALALLTPAVLAVGVPTAGATDHGDDGGRGGNGGVAAIGLDATTPANHNFGYNDFFPRDGVRIHSGDVIDFGWRQNLDGLHNVAVLQTGKTPDQGWAQYPTVVPDEDGPGSLQLNPLANLGNHPPAGSGAPGACGDAAAPCAYDGSSDLIEAANSTDGLHHFVVKVNAAPGSVVSFICLIHPGMTGSVQVVADGQGVTTPQKVQRLANSQLFHDTIGAFAAERAADHKQVAKQPDGTRLVTLRAGATAGKVELFEMLPRDVHLRPGDQVQWRYTAGNEIHTVTFPQGTDQGEPLVPACENTPTDDPFVPPVAGPPCGDPSKFELHVFPQPFGASTITDPTTFGSSGLIAAPGGPLPSTTGVFTFPNSGTFTYMCHIHDHMIGTIQVG
ncbi:MAG: cupredoxin domain-containing protein, partial [Ilumatobacteraceae bacterium]